MTSLKGQFVIAAPDLLDPNFARAIVLMFEHDKDGAAGVILNRPTPAMITDISDQIFSEAFEWDKPLHFGGPVVGPLLVVHATEGLADTQVLDGLYTTIDAAKVQILLRRRAEPSRIVANYAGWGPGQLEAEIKEGSWLLAPATPDRVFAIEDDDAWEAIVREVEANRIPTILGITELPDDPSLN